MSVDRIRQVGDKASEGQATGVYETGFTIVSLAKVEAGIGCGSRLFLKKELTEVGRMAGD